MENSSYNLVEWLDKEGLKKVQKSFYDMTGMSAAIVDMDGNLLVPKIGKSTLCDEIVLNSGMACEMCKQCHNFGANETGNIGKATYYYCHMGLAEFSAPIMVDGKMVAKFVGGMVYEKPPKEEKVRAIAKRYEIDEDALYDAAKEIAVIDTEVIKKGSEFVLNMSQIMASNADSRIQMERAGRELKKASDLKSDFLANMSHEIRTPMNAVIGLTDIALQEEMSDAASGYVKQIQNSGKALLNIINDILDYSKISSGKMDIIEEQYNPFALIKDVTSIISNRLIDKEKSVVLLVSMDPAIPKQLIGDAQRLRQILINIANNAVKFTEKGDISIMVSTTKISTGVVNFVVKVKDTGIGIRNEDQKRLFQSFTQVDSKRNRNVEGTGLGLAIVKQLVDLMGGEVSLESVYGKGSAFTISVPQKIADQTSGVKLKAPEKNVAAGIFVNQEVAENFQRVNDMLGIITQTFTPEVASKTVIETWLKGRSGKTRYIFIDQEALEKSRIKELVESASEFGDARFVLLENAYSDERLVRDMNFYKIIRKPMLCQDLATVYESDHVVAVKNTNEEASIVVEFRAPTAKVLVVDDNKTNMVVADKLLSRLGIDVEKAYSGKEAIDLIMVKEKLPRDQFYDIIFMDHMMPELDGIDTTRIIRRFYPKLDVIPIIALTANAMGDVKKMFMDEGMNDYISKPIDKKVLYEKLLEWLPKEKIVINQ